MVKNDESGNQNFADVLNKLREIELRLSILEKNLTVPATASTEPITKPAEPLPQAVSPEDEGIESSIGEYGMAWLGNIVLLFGVIFILQFLSSKGLTAVSGIFGLAMVAGVYYAGYVLRENHHYISRLFSYNGHLLLYIVTFTFHFGTDEPLLGSKSIELALLLAVAGSLGYLAYIRKSQVLTAIAFLMVSVTAVLGNSAPFMLSLMVLISGISVFYLYKYDWWRILLLSICLVYCIFFMWALNNPIMTHSFKVVGSLNYSYIFLLACAFIYSMVALRPQKGENDELLINLSIIMNGLGFSAIIALIILIFFKENYFIILGLISAFAIAYSAMLQSRGTWKISAALYALYGFAVLSIAIGGIFRFPLAFLLLSVQSLLVVSMALWFRSRFIVIMNVFLFIGLLLAYILFPKPLSSIDFTYALTALVSARIINWKKDRLEIRTELMRNIYLIMGFIMTLLSLYRAVPKTYVTLSWALAAALFFILSILLHNVKYRWLAISAVIITAFYFFLFDLRHVGTGYRIIALLFIAVISLSFSAFYARRMRKRKTSNPNET